MNDKKKKKEIVSIVTCETPLKLKDSQVRIKNILKGLSFEIEIYFHIGIPSQFLAILAKVKDEDKFVWELGSIRFEDLLKFSNISDDEIKEKICNETNTLLEKKLEDMGSSAEALLGQLEIYSGGIEALGSTPLVF